MASPAVSAGMMPLHARDWEFFRKAAHECCGRKSTRVSQELQGIVEGLRARTGSKLDVDDIVAFNASRAAGLLRAMAEHQQKTAQAPNLKSPGIAALSWPRSWTKNGQIVMATTTGRIIGMATVADLFDIAPKNGYRMLMDGFPGVIASDDDFGINSDGLMVTETTITRLKAWDPNGRAEFVRARKALQYAGSIDEYAKIMLDGNNGGYANDWLLGDRKTGEIAHLNWD